MLAAAVAMRGDDARACVGGDPTIASETTFDPSVLGPAVWPGLFFDSTVAGYGDRCADCLTKAIADDWRGYLGATVSDKDWAYVLYEASLPELSAIAAHLDHKGAIPKGLERSTLWNTGAPADKLRAAIDFVELARRVEAVDTFDGGYDAQYKPIVARTPSADLLAEAKAAFAGASKADPFLAQRYGLQLARVLFYRREWSAVESLYDTSNKLLLVPSTDVAFRARYYYAGALMHDSKRARANVELSRIAADDPALAGVAARDFQPMEDVDWKKSLALATTTRDKTALWRLVGIHGDPLAATREILKLDPASDLIGLLITRELNRLESISSPQSWMPKPDAATVNALKKQTAELEQLAGSLAVAKPTAQPWVMELVVAHLAARRGDVATARTHVQRALAARPNDPRVAAQAKASLAIAIATDWQINPAHEDELAKLMAGVAADKGYGRMDSVRDEVRGKLSKAYLAAGKLVDAELLVPNTLEPIDEYAQHPLSGSYDKSRWADATFIESMIARLGVTTTDFDKFVLQTSITKTGLETDLALRHLLDGDYAGAAKGLAGTKAGAELLHTDPFVLHVIDCHDCDQAKYDKSPATRSSFVAKLGTLLATANGTGEPAADASMQLGIASYNLTRFGNARIVLGGSHEESTNTRTAEKWFKRAYDLTADRDKKAKAAYAAAKCERARLWADIPPSPDNSDPAAGSAADPDLTPRTWYRVLKQYANTRYYKEVLNECGYFSAWSGDPARR